MTWAQAGQSVTVFLIAWGVSELVCWVVIRWQESKEDEA